MNLYDAQGRLINLGESIGRGGEATVYHVAGQESRLAKVYEPDPRPNYIYKLAWMVAHPPDNPTRDLQHPSLAWPDGLLYDARRRLKGYSMPFIERAVPLLEVFNPRRRAVVLPEFNRRYLHRTARNLAAAFSALHHSGYVAGDVNESNVLVTPSALVTLIDTDSFQVREERAGNAIIYHCPVGKPEYTPPELQGKALSEVTRLPEHDSFGLAVLIFQLLSEGSHPFRAQWLGAGDPPPIEARIAGGLFPYAEKHSEEIAPPKNAPGIDTLYPPLADLFRQCFVNGHRRSRWRPRPDVWAAILADAEQALVCCAEGHFYSSHLAECPYCPGAKQAAAARPSPAGQPRGASGARRPAGSPVSPGGRGTPARTPSAAAAAAATPGAGSPTPSPSPARTPRPPFRFSGRGSPAPASMPVGAAASPTITIGGRAVPGVLRGRPVFRPGGFRGWLWVRVQKSLLVGGVQGALVGALPGLLIGWLNWSAGTPLDWALVLALGGAAAGLLRGWVPGHRLAVVIEQSLGWKLFWQIVGTVTGAAGGFVLGLLLIWAIVPFLSLILGTVLGWRVGQYLGEQVWKLGSKVGWKYIWGVVSALGTAAIGWGISRLVAPIGLNQLGAELAVALLPFAANESTSWALLWAIAGATGSALAGAVVGVVVDMAGRVSNLVS